MNYTLKILDIERAHLRKSSGMANENEMLKIWRSSIQDISPESLLFRGQRGLETGQEAAIFWGKAAARSHAAWLRARPDAGSAPAPALVISPLSRDQADPRNPLPPGTRWIQGEHPIPGPGSLRAGAALLEFFDGIHRLGVSRLRIFLSGGASSLAWVPPASVSLEELRRRLEALYDQGLDIRELNRRRSALCALKAGGAARWLRRLAPRVEARVELISDVHPFGPEVVGSGPFTGSDIPHRIVIANPGWVEIAARRCRSAGLNVRLARSVAWGDWREWVRRIAPRVSELSGSPGTRGDDCVIAGGEPAIALPRRRGKGGRMTHLAAALGAELLPLLRQGRVELLCASSDGSDGDSGAAGAFIGRAQALAAPRASRWSSAVNGFRSAELLEEIGALIPGLDTGTNVQDLLIARVMR